jgi:hypothetical protein
MLTDRPNGTILPTRKLDKPEDQAIKQPSNYATEQPGTPATCANDNDDFGNS